MTGGLGAEIAAGLRTAGDRAVLVRGDRRFTGTEVLAMISAGTAVLTARGLHPGAAVACLYGEAPESVISRLIALTGGYRFIHLVPGIPVPTAAAAMCALGATALLWDPARRQDAAPLLAACPVPIQCRLDEDLFAPACPAPAAPTHGSGGPDAISAVMFSSGTTGRQKIVAYGRRAEAAHLAAARAVYGPGPWRFVVALGRGYMSALATLWTLAGGGTVVLEPAFDDAARLAEVIGRERVTHVMAGRPVVIDDLARDLAAPLNGPRQVIYGGAPASPAAMATAAERVSPVLTQTYGTTECGFLTVLTPDDHRRPDLLASVGRAVPGVGLRIRDPQGADLPPGDAGQVWARSGQSMLGYIDTPDEPPAANSGHDGWLPTGDLGRLTAEGHLFLLGRAGERAGTRDWLNS